MYERSEVEESGSSTRFVLNMALCTPCTRQYDNETEVNLRVMICAYSCKTSVPWILNEGQAV